MCRMRESAEAPQANRLLSLLLSGPEHPVIFAHRGDSFRAPENTLEAAEPGLGSRRSAWELDVQLTRDGVPIVLHDESLLRTTDVATKFAGDARGRTAFASRISISTRFDRSTPVHGSSRKTVARARLVRSGR